MAWDKYKEIKYALDGIPAENLTDFPKLVSIVADAEIASELGSGGGIKFTSADGNTDLAFGLYPSTVLTSGTILARVKVTLLTAASVGDVLCRLYYSSSESTTEDKAGTVVDYDVFMPLEEDPSGTAPQMFDWVSATNIGTTQGSMTSGDLVAGLVGQALDFDGSGDHIQTSVALNGNAMVTLEAWFKPTDDSTNRGLVAMRNRVNNLGLHLRAKSDGKIRFTKSVAANTESFNVDSTNSYTANVWNYAAATQVSSTNRNLYLNGVFEGNSTNVAGDNNNRSVDIGVGFAIAKDLIDEVRISSVVRSPNWIAYAYVDDGDNSATFMLSDEEGGSPGDSVLGAATATVTATVPIARKIASTPVASITAQAIALESRKTALTPAVALTSTGIAHAARKIAATDTATAMFTATIGAYAADATTTPPATITAIATIPTGRKTAITPIATAAFIATPATSGAVIVPMPPAIVTSEALPLVSRKLAAIPSAIATFTATAIPGTTKTATTTIAVVTATATIATTNLDTLIVFVSTRLRARRFVTRLTPRRFVTRLTPRRFVTRLTSRT